MLYKRRYILRPGKLIEPSHTNTHFRFELDLISTQDYLVRFGYLSRKWVQLKGMDALLNNFEESPLISSAIRQFQTTVNIDVTGSLNRDTLHWMKIGRCGVSDANIRKPDDENQQQPVFPSSNYVLYPTKWNETEISYKVTRYTSDFNNSYVDETFADLFAKWADVIPIRIRPAYRSSFAFQNDESPLIEIRWASRDHGDNMPFDAAAKTLAHSFFPPFYKSEGVLLPGDIHFNNDFSWGKPGQYGSMLIIANNKLKITIFYLLFFF